MKQLWSKSMLASIFFVVFGIFSCNRKSANDAPFPNSIVLSEKFQFIQATRISLVQNDSNIHTNPIRLKDVWINDKNDTIAIGVYKNGHPYDGKFLVIETFPHDTSVYFEDKANGALVGTEVFDINVYQSQHHFYVPFSMSYSTGFEDWTEAMYSKSGENKEKSELTNYKLDVDKWNRSLLKISSLPPFHFYLFAGHSVEVFRYFYLPTFLKPIIFNCVVVSPIDSPVLQIVVLNGASGYPGTSDKVIFDTTIYLNCNQADSLHSLIDATSLFSTKLEHGFSCGDGTSWELEGCRSNIYYSRSYSCDAPMNILNMDSYLKSFIKDTSLYSAN